MRFPKPHYLIVLSLFFFICEPRLGYPEEQTQKVSIFNVQKGEIEKVDKINKTDEEWKKILTAQQYWVTRRKGTEKAFSGQYHSFKGKGIYQCICCTTDLFSSDTKFDSGTGWPSFWAPISTLNVEAQADNSFFMQRTEVLCSRCGAHLGHVFDDGPEPTHKRFCINSIALQFMAKEK